MLYFLPDFFHIFERQISKRLSRRSSILFHSVETLSEFEVRLSQAGFGVEVELPRQIRDYEQQIADLVGQPGRVGVRKFCANLGDFLIKFAQHGRRVGPVEADPGGASRQLGGARQGREAGRDGGQGARLGFRGPLGTSQATLCCAASRAAASPKT